MKMNTMVDLTGQGSLIAVVVRGDGGPELKIMWIGKGTQSISITLDKEAADRLTDFIWAE